MKYSSRCNGLCRGTYYLTPTDLLRMLSNRVTSHSPPLHHHPFRFHPYAQPPVPAHSQRTHNPTKGSTPEVLPTNLSPTEHCGALLWRDVPVPFYNLKLIAFVTSSQICAGSAYNSWHRRLQLTTPVGYNAAVLHNWCTTGTFFYSILKLCIILVVYVYSMQIKLQEWRSNASQCILTVRLTSHHFSTLATSKRYPKYIAVQPYKSKTFQFCLYTSTEDMTSSYIQSSLSLITIPTPTTSDAQMGLATSSLPQITAKTPLWRLHLGLNIDSCIQICNSNWHSKGRFESKHTKLHAHTLDCLHTYTIHVCSLYTHPHELIILDCPHRPTYSHTLYKHICTQRYSCPLVLTCSSWPCSYSPVHPPSRQCGTLQSVHFCMPHTACQQYTSA